jgi:hypothetical protein
MYFKFFVSHDDPLLEVQIENNSAILYDYVSSQDTYVYTKFGLILNFDNTFVDYNENKGQFFIPAKTQETITFTNFHGDSTITPIIREVI